MICVNVVLYAWSEDCECGDAVLYTSHLIVFLFRFKHVLDVNSQSTSGSVDLLLNEIRNAIETTQFATSFSLSLFFFIFFFFLLRYLCF